MRDIKKGLSEEARLLDEYLLRYSLLVKRKKNLEARRNEIINEFNSPLSGVGFDRMPKGNRIGDGCAVLPLQVCDIEIRIKENIEEIKKDYQKINDIIDFLPGTSREKLILEYRYIDRMGWDKICRTENMAKTPVIYLWRRGLYQLLEFAKIKKLVSDMRKCG